ncbi:MAG TPA: glutathione S-transferase family protein [Xanthobacteraceae bacterium]|nr:glutathione S-transferase family protein [Xanthobacteraceae bacterium]
MGRRLRLPPGAGDIPATTQTKLSDHGAAMMILRSSPSSPFGRKVRIAIALLGFEADVKIEPANTTDGNDSVRRQNPLGKIPVVIAEDGTAYYDSRVILDYLDHRAGDGKIVPRDATARLAALRLQALCDGILDASILTIYETRWRKAESHEPKWLEHQAGKVTRALAALEAAPPPLDPVPQVLPNVGEITLACALGYRDFRFGGSWRSDHPRLVAWLDNFAAWVPAFAATKPMG